MTREKIAEGKEEEKKEGGKKWRREEKSLKVRGKESGWVCFVSFFEELLLAPGRHFTAEYVLAWYEGKLNYTDRNKKNMRISFSLKALFLALWLKQ